MKHDEWISQRTRNNIDPILKAVGKKKLMKGIDRISDLRVSFNMMPVQQSVPFFC